MESKKKRLIEYSIAYTVQKYSDLIDFKKIANKSILEYRHLLANIVALREEFELIRKKREKHE